MAARKIKAPPKPDVKVIDVEQGTDEWREVRLGIPTASRFGDVLAAGYGNSRTAYLYDLAGERISGIPADQFENHHMRRGREMEPQARAQYEWLRRCEVQRVGFVRRGRLGASPDGFVGDRGLVEFKSLFPRLLIPLHKTRKVPLEHMPQCHGEMLVCERDYCDLNVYWPQFPDLTFRIGRDESYLARLQPELDRFCDELDALVYRLRGDRGKLAHERTSEIPY